MYKCVCKIISKKNKYLIKWEQMYSVDMPHGRVEIEPSG